MSPARATSSPDLEWSRSADFLAYRDPGEGLVCWIQMRRIRYLDGHKGRYDDLIGVPGVHGSARASAYTWVPKQNAILALDPERGELTRIDVESGEREDLLAIRPEGKRQPRILISPNRSRMALVVPTRGDREVEVRILECHEREVVSRTLKILDDMSACALPFWINEGSLGLVVISTARRSSEILALEADGSGEKVLLESATVDPFIAPAVSRSGRYLAFYRRRFASRDEGPSDLLLYDLDQSTSGVLLGSERMLGALHFGEETIAISGPSASLSIWMRNLDDRRLPPPRF